jgi:hypothetical protein
MAIFIGDTGFTNPNQSTSRQGRTGGALPASASSGQTSSIGSVPISNNLSNNAHSGQPAPATSTSKSSQNMFTPTSKVNEDPMNHRYISYPKDVTNDMANGHYMIFYVNVQNKTGYNYTAPGGADVGGYLEYEVTTGNPHTKGPTKTGKFRYTKVKGDKIEYEDAFNRVSRGGKGNKLGTNVFLTPNSAYANSKYGQSGGVNAKFKTTTRITDSVALYLPPNVKDTTSAGYNDNSTGIVGLVAAGGGAFLDAMKRNDYTAASKSLISGVGQISAEALQRAGGGFVDVLAGTEGSADLANKVFGQANNPYMEVMFDSMAMRSFQYNFTFSPRNAAERDDVQDIIKLFRFHMAPELKGAQHRFLGLPSTFDIHYMYQHSQNYAAENNFYSKIATCVLESVDVDYTPGGVKSFQDGSPTQIQMNLSFKETEMLNKQMINAGY